MIWLVGTASPVGREIIRLADHYRIPICSGPESLLNIEGLRAYGFKKRPDWIINCIDSDDNSHAETKEELAYAVNAHGARNLAVVASELDVPLIHLSTDRVFSGVWDERVDEDTPANPLSIFGSSKLAGEKAVQSVTDKCYILRVADLYGECGAGPVDSLLRRVLTLSTLDLPADQFVSPSWARDAANWILTIIQGNHHAYGLYHCAAAGTVSFYGLGVLMAQFAEIAGLLAQRPQFRGFESKNGNARKAVLDTKKFINNFGGGFPAWEHSLNRYIRTLQ